MGLRKRRTGGVGGEIAVMIEGGEGVLLLLVVGMRRVVPRLGQRETGTTGEGGTGISAGQTRGVVPAEGAVSGQGTMPARR